jgi:predicted ATPase
VKLPPDPTRFIGRERDLERIASELAAGRLVTVSGPPGIGKSRAVWMVARRAKDEVCFGDVSQTRDLSSLSSAVAKAIGIDAGGDPIEGIARALGSRGQLLVVLDGFEAVAAHAPDSLGVWLGRAPHARFLVASRERLRLLEERVVELGPLELSGEAVELLLERLRAHRPDYQPSAKETEQLVAVARALEGIPLAIELAASRIDLLGLDGLLERLTERLELLSRGARGNERQGTLRGAIAWSWQLLDDAQKRALSIASVFRGTFSPAAAEAVIGRDAIDRLQDLRDRSLVHTPEPGRYALYESVRAFADEMLEERDAAHARHAAHYRAFGEKEARRFELHGGSVEALAEERDNLLAVIDRSLAAKRYGDAVSATLALGPVLTAHGPAGFHLELLDRVIDAIDDEPRLLVARGAVRRALGDLAGAEEDLLTALEGADDSYAAARKELGLVYQLRRDIDRARACYEAALPAAQDRRLQGAIIGNLGTLDHDTGGFEHAAQRYQAALDIFREVGDVRYEGIFLTNLGVLEQEQGRRTPARKNYERALELLAESGDRRYEAIALGNLGVLEHEDANLPRARELHDRALALLRQVGDVHSEALCLARLGAVTAALGDIDSGERRLDEAERLVIGRDRLGLALVRLHRCFLDVARGDEAQAFARLEAAQAPQEEGPSLVELSDDARMVMRMLAAPLSRGDGPRLKLGPEARWFEPPGAPRQDLERFAAARRILERLAQERMAHPGRPVSAEELFEAGWPGVRILPASAHNRLHVQLAKLRKMGLKLVLLRTDQGYLLDPDTPLLWRPAA